LPGCSACGYAVDFLRACYTSSRRLYKDRPDVVTVGRYWFAPPGTPHLPFPHIFGSLNWMRGEVTTSPPIGEVLEAPRPFFDGALLVQIPSAVVVGNPLCLTEGDQFPPPTIPGRQSIDGIDSRCYARRFGAGPSILEDFDLDSCAVLLALATLQLWLYDDVDKIAPFLDLWLGAPITTTTVENSTSLVPGTIICDTPDFILVVVSGTTNELQLATQGLYSATGPFNFGTYSTMPIWQFAQLRIDERITATVPDNTKPLMIVGHSYGAVVATLLAGRYHAALPNRKIRLFTMGMPKPGDARVDQRIRGIVRLHLANSTDPVPALPPRASDLAFLVDTIPVHILNGWFQFVAPSQSEVLQANGDHAPAPDPTMDWPTCVAIVAQVLAAEPLDPFTGHYSTEYVRRLIRCLPDNAFFPVAEDVVAVLKIPTDDIWGEGGICVAGSAEFLHAAFITGEGGVGVAGEASLSRLNQIVGQGGVGVKGEGLVPGLRVIVGQGGVNIGGEGLVPGLRVIVGQGGEATDGSAEFNPGGDDVFTGSILAFAGSSLPTGYLDCDGSAVSRTTYAALFTAIGTTWGIGDGSTTFNLPDLRGRAVIGVGTGSGLSARALADTGGVETVALSTAELASHTHTVTDPGHTHAPPGSGSFLNDFTVAPGNVSSGTRGHVDAATGSATTGISLGSAGSGTAHENLQPFRAAYWIIKT